MSYTLLTGILKLNWKKGNENDKMASKRRKSMVS